MKKNVEVHYRSETLPRSVINHVNHFLFFVGYARSGYSIIASMLDAHPNVVIPHEYALFENGSMNQHSTAIRSGCSRFTVYRGLRTQQALMKGSVHARALTVPGSWQGRYDTLQLVLLVFLLLGTSQGGCQHLCFVRTENPPMEGESGYKVHIHNSCVQEF